MKKDEQRAREKKPFNGQAQRFLGATGTRGVFDLKRALISPDLCMLVV